MKYVETIRRIGILMMFGIVFFNCSMANNRNLPGVTIISRSEWGANESIRLRKSTTILSTASGTTSNTSSSQTTQTKNTIDYSAIRNAWMAKNYPNERKYEGSNKMLGNNYLSYPEYFNHHKNKIVIHHTAMDYNSNWTIDDVKKHLQGIYKYHTIDRKFGDIGYNFLIDQLGNIYEGRAGGEGAVGMHASSNNVSSIGIALLGNFENDVPTEAQLSSLVNLVTALSRYYNIDPLGKTHTFELNTSKEPYVTAKVNYNIMGHEDIKATACPGKNLYPFIPKIREEVVFRLKNGIVGDVALPTSRINALSNVGGFLSLNTGEVSTTKSNITTGGITTSNNNSNSIDSVISLLQKDPDAFKKAAQGVRKRYSGKLIKATKSTQKFQKKYNINDVKELMNKNISVLLYELTTKYDSFNVRCKGSCVFNIDGINYNWSGATLTLLSNKINIVSDRNISANKVTVKSFASGGTVEITNYTRKSYVGVPWNIFKGELSFEKGMYPLVNGEQKSDFIVVNTLSFSEYMKGIVETNDTETLEKNKVMAMISKNYALFYLNGDNIHPSIPENANYRAIDDPNFFQKYVGAGLEQTLIKWYQALNETSNKIVMYDGYLPILPYFSCSAGFTLSAEEKRGRNDTPYLESVYDFGGCSDFIGHGVGLAGQGAERLAKKGMKYKDILNYYYSGVEVVDIN